MFFTKKIQNHEKKRNLYENRSIGSLVSLFPLSKSTHRRECFLNPALYQKIFFIVAQNRQEQSENCNDCG